MFALHDLESIINTIADPIFVKDRQHRWILLNDAYCRFMGYAREELIGKSDHDFFPQAEADVFWAKDECVFESGGENSNDEDFTDNAGITHSITTKKTLYVTSTGEQFIVGCIRDLTALKRAQQDLERARVQLALTVAQRTDELQRTNEALRRQIQENERTADQLRQSQKMEAMGRLAGGIAHDFNNLLNVIIGYTALLQGRVDADPDLHQSAAQITAAAEKAASLTRQLLAFSRKQVLKPEVLNLDEILQSMGSMLARVMGEDVELYIEPPAAPACIMADRGQIEQVIMNLAVNARDAMPEGGRLTVATAVMDVGETSARHQQVPPGQYVRLTVTDTGLGMDTATQAHIFEPFFTTKAPGKGTGLGLATVYGIVRQTAGQIQVFSRPGQGTTLQIYFPRVADALPDTAPAAPLEARSRGSETILLVEDQENLRRLLCQVLESAGYTVLEAEAGQQAIVIANRNIGRIDLLITDVVMPGMRGWELARRLLELRPATKVLYISGHTDTDLVQDGSLIAGDALLEKPFRPDVLLAKVREILTPIQQAKAG